ncbi:hypothetical protein TNCT_596521 [Trichonephila clavata]|uniref:Uncharacterized protein n=1 Tax=Trichonephila clavata TaxID=2740835 RepID=A0A8X6FE70_TRICU|nr:hypothetical protein TNCT_596521 [Trichonephila clavata]
MTSEPVDVDEFDMPEPGYCTDFTDLGLTPTSAEHDEVLGVGFSRNHLDDSAVSVVFGRKEISVRYDAREAEEKKNYFYKAEKKDPASSCLDKTGFLNDRPEDLKSEIIVKADFVGPSSLLGNSIMAIEARCLWSHDSASEENII